MSRATKARRAAKELTRSIHYIDTLDLIDGRLQRACDIMTALDFIMEQEDADLDLAALALAARDLIDRVRDDLSPIRQRIEKAVVP